LRLPRVVASLQPWDLNQKIKTTLKALGLCDTNPPKELDA